jgi:hypothetical protein
MAGWQWLYIVEGVITVALGIAVILVLPDFPQNWKRLSPEMKHVATRRMAIEAAQADVDDSGGMSHVKRLFLAMKDLRVHVMAIGYMTHTAAGGFQFVFPTLTKTLGYSNTVSLLLCAPPYVFVAIWSVVHSWLSDRHNKRFIFVVYLITLVIAGYIIFMTCTNFAARYISLFLILLVFCINERFTRGLLRRFPARQLSVLRHKRISKRWATVRQHGHHSHTRTQISHTTALDLVSTSACCVPC